MKKYKLLIADYDGTLANSNHEISKENLNAINDFISRGGIFAVCTGRATDSIKKILDRVNYKGLLASFNGAVLTDLNTGEELFKKGLDKQTAIKFFNYAVEKGLYSHFYLNKGYLYFKHTDYTNVYEKVTGVKGRLAKDIIGYIETTSEITPKILSFDDKEKLDVCYPDLVDLLPECDVVRSTDNMLDVNLKGVDKGGACELIANAFGLTSKDCIAAGDAGNDIPMLKAAGLSFAMANAEDSAKAFANKIAPSNDEDGIKYIIENYCI